MSLFDLTGKTALITGASSGLGEQFAHCLSKAGARVIVAARRKDKLQDLAKRLGNALPLEMNVGDKKSVQKAFEYLENAQEKIDICINSAGVAKRTPIFEEEETDHFENILHTNVAGLWYVTKVAANHMKHHGIQGSIINMGSVNGANRVGEEFAAYCASKAAVAQMTKALVGELSRHQIRINCIAPGLFHTPLTDYRLNMKEEREEMEKFIPAGFVATPPDLDGAILYLSSNTASRYVTGVCLTVDGGISWGG